MITDSSYADPTAPAPTTPIFGWSTFPEVISGHEAAGVPRRLTQVSIRTSLDAARDRTSTQVFGTVFEPIPCCMGSLSGAPAATPEGSISRIMKTGSKRRLL
jgi:hypothetical protein